MVVTRMPHLERTFAIICYHPSFYNKWKVPLLIDKWFLLTVRACTRFLATWLMFLRSAWGRRFYITSAYTRREGIALPLDSSPVLHTFITGSTILSSLLVRVCYEHRSTVVSRTRTRLGGPLMLHHYLWHLHQKCIGYYLIFLANNVVSHSNLGHEGNDLQNKFWS